MKIWPSKDPQEEADFTWTVPLDSGDAIASITSTDVTAGTVTLGTGGKAPSHDDSVVTLWLSGGVAGETAIVRIEVLTEAGRTFEEDCALSIVELGTADLAAFRLRFPGLAAVADEAIRYWLSEGTTEVASWPADNDRAALLYAAHKLTEAQQAGGVAQGVTMFRSGSFQAQMSDAAAGRTGFSATVPGREFLALARRHFSGPRLAWEPSDCA